jgi:hypothetical protein
MGRTIEAAAFAPGTAPQVQNYVVASGQTFIQGTPVVYTGATGTIIAATAPITTAILVGISAEPAFHQPGYQLANADFIFTPVTYALAKCAVFTANETTVFSSRIVNNSAVPVVPVVGDINTNYGLTSWANNFGKLEWAVDRSVTGGNACVEVIKIDTFLNIVFFKVMSARLAQP